MGGDKIILIITNIIFRMYNELQNMNRSLFVIFFVLFLALPSLAQYPFSLFMEYTDPYKMWYSTSGEHLVYFDSSALGIGAQHNMPINGNLEGSLGVIYYFPRTISLGSSEGLSHSSIKDGSINYLPIFGRIKYTFDPKSDLKIYIGGDLRYTLISVSGRYFNGVTANNRLGSALFSGIEIINGFGIEAGEVIQNGSLDYKDSTADFTDLSTYIRSTYSF
jgi:hypothetical protein